MNQSIIYIFFGFTVLLSSVSATASKLKSETYLECLASTCSSYIKDSQSVPFFGCAKKIDNCMISNIFQTSFSSDFTYDKEQDCIATCTQQSVESNPQSAPFFKNLQECSNSCLSQQINENSENDTTFNVTIFVVIFGLVFIIGLCLTIYHCIKRSQKNAQKFEWQVQQEANARRGTDGNIIINVVGPTPLPQLPEGDYYKSVSHPSQLKAKKIEEEFANFLFESAYKKFYGDQAGIPGVVQFGIPMFAYPPVKQTHDLKIEEAEIIIPEKQEKQEHFIIEIPAVESDQVQIQSNKPEQQEIQEEENNDDYIINFDEDEEGQKKEVEELACQVIQIKKSASSRAAPTEQIKCVSVRKQSATLFRQNKNQNQAQQNMRRQTRI